MKLKIKSALPGKKKASLKKSPANEQRALVGAGLSFAAKEAYKLLRTNLDFALNDVENCRVVGITSSIRGEGKSLTSVNLAYSLAEAGNRVLLLEADMRIPSLGKKLRLSERVGLSNALVAPASEPLPLLDYVIDPATGRSFHVLTAGDTPPNPSELLSSRRMQLLMERLSGFYDYILVDLPPVTAVADALVVSKLVDGVIMIVRHDYSERGPLAEAMRLLQFSNTRLLGFAFNCASESGAGYSKRYRYKSRYYRSYYYQRSPGEKQDSNA